ncbi:hypothetical protein GCM10009602_21100 [Nocardiopsis tropica]
MLTPLRRANSPIRMAQLTLPALEVDIGVNSYGSRMDTTSGTSPLLSPARLAGIDLPNRLVIAPMTRNRAEPSGAASALMAEYYAQRASAGLVIAEASTPNAVGQTYPNIAALTAPSTSRAGGRSPAAWRRRAAACSSRSSTGAASATPPPAG